MQEELKYLKILTDQLRACSDLHSRLSVLDRDLKVIMLLEKPSFLRSLLAGLSPECSLVIKSLVAMGQEHLLVQESMHGMDQCRALLNDLLPVESFYKDIGGIAGYHYTLLSLMCSETEEVGQDYLYHRPPGRDISHQSREVDAHILEGIRALEYMAELYPVGGAADRLHLIEPETGLLLPAARLHFCGKTLLEALIEDVQAREYLFYKLHGKQITLPVGMMTSHEKDNHRQILSICEQNGWFGRPKEAFHFFCQPAVPLVDKEGKWCQSPEGRLLMKPGGHGVIWKLAQESGIFDAWKKRGVKKILVRQINNPVAGCDYGLLAFAGIGWAENKAFGFASCPRQVEAAEGINVLLQKKQDALDEYCLTNVEYCDFKKWGIEDKPSQEGGDYSLFPSNTNILFADLNSIEAAINRCPIPGTIVNLKKIALLDNNQAARLESTMQNIADCLIDHCDPAANEKGEQLQQALRTFLTYHVRRKTISTTKRAFSGGSFLETPEGCFYDILQNARDLLIHFCQYDVPMLDSCERTLCHGPDTTRHRRARGRPRAAPSISSASPATTARRSRRARRRRRGRRRSSPREARRPSPTSKTLGTRTCTGSGSAVLTDHDDAVSAAGHGLHVRDDARVPSVPRPPRDAEQLRAPAERRIRQRQQDDERCHGDPVHQERRHARLRPAVLLQHVPPVGPHRRMTSPRWRTRAPWASLWTAPRVTDTSSWTRTPSNELYGGTAPDARVQLTGGVHDLPPRRPSCRSPRR